HLIGADVRAGRGGRLERERAAQDPGDPFVFARHEAGVAGAEDRVGGAVHPAAVVHRHPQGGRRNGRLQGGGAGTAEEVTVAGVDGRDGVRPRGQGSRGHLGGAVLQGNRGAEVGAVYPELHRAGGRAGRRVAGADGGREGDRLAVHRRVGRGG